MYKDGFVFIQTTLKFVFSGSMDYDLSLAQVIAWRRKAVI